MLQSQYPVGGWPQRWPLRHDFVRNGKADYSSFITINDGVHTGNIHFLLDCWRILGEERVMEPIQRAMNCVLVLQGGKPQECISTWTYMQNMTRLINWLTVR